MAELYGQRWSRSELERRVGHVSQLGGVRLLASDNGPSRGVRLIDAAISRSTVSETYVRQHGIVSGLF